MDDTDPTALAPRPLQQMAEQRLERLGEGGLEMAPLLLIELVGLLLAPVTLTLSSVASSLLAATYMGIKDLWGGKWSPARRVGRSELVDHSTGRAITRPQALLRNSPYVAAWLLAALPDPLGWVGLLAVGALLGIDLCMVLLDPQGRRLGDRIARTRRQKRTPED